MYEQKRLAQRRGGAEKNTTPILHTLRPCVSARETPNTALRLEKFLGMSAGFWMDLQLRWDLYHAHEQGRKDLESIEPYTAATPH